MGEGGATEQPWIYLMTDNIQDDTQNHFHRADMRERISKVEVQMEERAKAQDRINQQLEDSVVLLNSKVDQTNQKVDDMGHALNTKIDEMEHRISEHINNNHNELSDTTYSQHASLMQALHKHAKDDSERQSAMKTIQSDQGRVITTIWTTLKVGWAALGIAVLAIAFVLQQTGVLNGILG